MQFRMNATYTTHLFCYISLTDFFQHQLEVNYDGVTHFRKLFRCDFCGKIAPSRFALKRHLTTHTGDKPFECPVCHRAFSQKATLKRHMMVVHRQLPQ